MSEPIGDLTLHAVLEVKRTSLDNCLWKIEMTTFGGTTFDLVLYRGVDGDEPCPFLVGDLYGTDYPQHGGWYLTRLPQEQIDQVKKGRSDYEALSVEEKAKRSQHFLKIIKGKGYA